MCSVGEWGGGGGGGGEETKEFMCVRGDQGINTCMYVCVYVCRGGTRN